MLNNFVKSDNPNLKAESLVNGNYLQSLSDTLQCGSTTGRTMTKFGDITRKHEVCIILALFSSLRLVFTDYSIGKCYTKGYHEETS